jgi:hypothetical protein
MGHRDAAGDLLLRVRSTSASGAADDATGQGSGGARSAAQTKAEAQRHRAQQKAALLERLVAGEGDLSALAAAAGLSEATARDRIHHDFELRAAWHAARAAHQAQVTAALVARIDAGDDLATLTAAWGVPERTLLRRINANPTARAAWREAQLRREAQPAALGALGALTRTRPAGDEPDAGATAGPDANGAGASGDSA